VTRRAHAPHPDTAAFGVPEADETYIDRDAVYGVLADDQGHLAVVRITENGQVWHDLPGGGVEAGETAHTALIREFAEETGLGIAVNQQSFARAVHLWRKPGIENVRNHAAYFSVTATGLQGGKVEEDHHLVWLSPLTAITLMRHEAAAWAIARWIRLNAHADLAS